MGKSLSLKQQDLLEKETPRCPRAGSLKRRNTIPQVGKSLSLKQQDLLEKETPRCPRAGSLKRRNTIPQVGKSLSLKQQDLLEKEMKRTLSQGRIEAAKQRVAEQALTRRTKNEVDVLLDNHLAQKSAEDYITTGEMLRKRAQPGPRLKTTRTPAVLSGGGSATSEQFLGPQSSLFYPESRAGSDEEEILALPESRSPSVSPDRRRSALPESRSPSVSPKSSPECRRRTPKTAVQLLANKWAARATQQGFLLPYAI